MKNLFLFVLAIILLGCSSSDGGDSSGDSKGNTYFRFTRANFSSDIEKSSSSWEICWHAAPSDDGSKVDILAQYKDPNDNQTYCGATISNLNNSVGINKNILIGISYNGGISNNATVELTEVGNYYIGKFSGVFEGFDEGGIPFSSQGTGSFKIPKVPY
jgi:hypothetical protein